MDESKPKNRAATVWYAGRFLNLAEYTLLRLREQDARCDRGAPFLDHSPDGFVPHAPDCAWTRTADDAAQDFADLWAEQGENGGRMIP